MANVIQRWTATVGNLLLIRREGWPAEAYSKKMPNFIKRWSGTIKILLILIREGLPSELGENVWTFLLGNRRVSTFLKVNERM